MAIKERSSVKQTRLANRRVLKHKTVSISKHEVSRFNEEANATTKPVHQSPETQVIESSFSQSSLNSRDYGSQYLRTALPIWGVDLLALSVAIIVANFFAVWIWSEGTAITFPLGCMLAGALSIAFVSIGLYPGFGMNPIYEFRQCLIGTTLVFMFAILANLNPTYSYLISARAILIAYPLMLLMISVSRTVARRVLSQMNWWGMKAIIFGCNRRVNKLYRMHEEQAVNGFKPIGYVQRLLPKKVDEKLTDKWLGVPNESSQLIKAHRAHIAIVHRSGRSEYQLANFVEQHLSDFSQVVIVADEDRLPTLWANGGNGGLLIKDRLLQPSSQIIKRVMDVSLSLLGLVFSLPVFVGIAIWMKLTDPGPIFFGHERIGRYGKRFDVWKFRSMCVNADEILKQTLEQNLEQRAEWEATQKLQDDPRVSSVGNFLRMTSLDELPQLWNVLKGEMSLVGPRPIVANEVQKYDNKFKSYLKAVPGVTGFWQISGRNLTTYERRVELDDFYVRNWSISFDLYILVRTVKTVLFREGAF
ncbi:MAG: undecaprenyl-phosphate galactose phosphotransferase WbaP [Planctomycetota bacterium]